MTTNHFKYLIILMCCFSLTLLQTGCSKVERPNIIFIFADDLGMESLTPYGGHSTITPGIDRLAEQGMRFNYCFANPKCSPSRAEVLTGTYPGITGMTKVLSHYEENEFLDPGRFNSFANQLKKAGYTTAIAGKWNLSYLEKNNTIKAFGFDEHCLWQMYDKNKVKRSRYYHPYFRINDTIVEADISDRFGPDVMCDFLIDFIKRNEDKPFMVYYPSLIPHIPYVKVPDDPDVETVPDNEQRNGPECFPAMVNYLDKNISRLVNTVEECGISDNTIIIFSSDNGTAKNVTSVWGKDRIDIPGGKSTMTDRGSRVPLIIKWPGKISAGSRCDDLVELADFLPTFTELASAPPPVQRVHGQSFLPQLLGKKGNPRQWVHIEHVEDRQIRTRDWIYTNKDKLIKVNELGQPENEPEKDGTHQDIRDDLRKIFTMIDVKH
jgi:arylsulfatase A-like enzyme